MPIYCIHYSDANLIHKQGAGVEFLVFVFDGYYYNVGISKKLTDINMTSHCTESKLYVH